LKKLQTLHRLDSLLYISPVKSASALTLLCLFIYQLGGWLIPFYAHQQGIRHEIKQRIKKGVPQGELVFIEANEKNLSEIEWENDHEFRFEGKLYDVVETKYEAGIKSFACINDQQEERLFENLDLLVKKELEKEAKGLLLKKGSSLPFLQASAVHPILLSEHLKKTFPPNSWENYLSPSLSLNIPPPKGT